jgi:hypothetical protein
MDSVSAQNAFSTKSDEPVKRLMIALDLMEAAISFKRQQLRRMNPSISKEDLNVALQLWLKERPSQSNLNSR